MERDLHAYTAYTSSIFGIAATESKKKHQREETEKERGTHLNEQRRLTLKKTKENKHEFHNTIQTSQPINQPYAQTLQAVVKATPPPTQTPPPTPPP